MTIQRTVTVTVLSRTAGLDEYGDPITPTGVGHTIEHCAISPRTSSDITVRGRAGVVVGATLYAPAGADLLRSDQVTVDAAGFDGVWEIEGEVAVRESLSGRAPGVQAALRRAEG